jgi:hypothetical protein
VARAAQPLISTTVSGTVIENTSPVVTYEMNSVQSAARLKRARDRQCRELEKISRHAHHFGGVRRRDREQSDAELRVLHLVGRDQRQYGTGESQQVKVLGCRRNPRHGTALRYRLGRRRSACSARSSRQRR